MEKQIGYLHLEYHQSFNQYDKKLYEKTYLKLINEWAKELYTPYSFLSDIIYKVERLNKNLSWIIEYDYSQIFKIIQPDYKYYADFYNKLKTAYNIKIRIASFNFDDHLTYDKLLKIYSKQTVYDFYNLLHHQNIQAICFSDYEYNIERGCLICLNNKIINLRNKEDLETTLNHEINHYFSNISEVQDVKAKNLSPIQIYDKVALEAGYDITSYDFKKHMLENSEFNSMCADVCNILEFNVLIDNNYQQTYYKWLNWCTEKFICLAEYKSLDSKLQDIIFFSFTCRLLDVEKWNKLKLSVYKQLKEPTINIFKSAKNKLIDFLMLRKKKSLSKNE